MVAGYLNKCPAKICLPKKQSRTNNANSGRQRVSTRCSCHEVRQLKGVGDSLKSRSGRQLWLGFLRIAVYSVSGKAPTQRNSLPQSVSQPNTMNSTETDIVSCEYTRVLAIVTEVRARKKTDIQTFDILPASK